jgi:hypothetical protein
VAWPDDAVLVGVDGDPDPVPQAQLGEDADDVALDGGLAEEEAAGDLGVGQALTDSPCFSMMLLSSHVLPDPTSLPDRRRRLAAQGKGPSSAVDTALHRALGAERPSAGGAPSAHAVCPHLAASGGPGGGTRA